MAFHHGQAVMTRNTPQAYSQWATLLKWVCPRAFQADIDQFFLQFAGECLDWWQSTKGKVRYSPQCGAITLGIHGTARYNRSKPDKMTEE
jgi:hypothetical protein